MNFLKPEHLILRKSRSTQNLLIPVTEKFAFARKVLKVTIEDVFFRSDCFYGNWLCQYLYIADYDLGFISV